MLLDRRAAFSNPQILAAGSTASDELDTQTTGEQTGYDIQIVLTLISAEGTVSATLQESDDKLDWRGVVTYANLVIGSTGGGLPLFSKRFLRVLWQSSGAANVMAALTFAAPTNQVGV